MCNYGRSTHVESGEMVSFVKEALDSIDVPVDELYVSPSGSLLDTVEVPRQARLGIYRLVDRFPAKRFCFETRAETVTATSVDELARSLRGKQLAVGLGLESSDPWVLRFSVNKLGQTEDFARAAGILRNRCVSVYANISLGSAFLAPREAIDSTVQSVEWSLRNGADLAIVFPMQVKSNTLLAWLHNRGLYHPPSLWSLIEVLRAVDRALLPSVGISWYRTDYGSESGVVASPGTCPECRPRVMKALDRYRADPSERTLDGFAQLWCDCRSLWLADLSAPPTVSRTERALSGYELLVEELGLEEWWTEHADSLRIEMGEDCL